MSLSFTGESVRQGGLASAGEGWVIGVARGAAAIKRGRVRKAFFRTFLSDSRMGKGFMITNII
ncbi:hypothetical protein BIV08_23830 [Pseudomonas sp. AF76]|nr:hypothetical protein BIV08_23830 [Pseudomonas sp. AF76]